MQQGSKGILVRALGGMPVLIPSELLRRQASLGPEAALVWINICYLAQRGRPLVLDELANQMGLTKRQIGQALALLADHGWIDDQDLEIKLVVPESEEKTAAAREPILDAEQAAFEWLVDYWSVRVAPPSADEMRKLFYWMDRKGLSHEVIAVAIEEMFVGASQPGFPYLEGILRNWHGVGIRSYNDLLEKPHLTKVLGPIAAKKTRNPAEESWREVFPDEFD